MMPEYRITLAEALSKQSWDASGGAQPLEPARDELRLLAARGEVTGFQVRVQAGEDFVLLVDGANWLHPLGFLPRLRLEARFAGLPPGAVELLPVGYVEGDDGRLWMETLERSGYADVPAGRPQAVYARLRVPRDAAAGTYTGSLRALAQQGFADEQVIWEGTVQLEVADALLPEPRDFAFHLNLWQHLTAIARYHRVTLWSEAHFALIDRYYASLAELGQKVVSIVATEFPWSGQRCFRETDYPSYLFEHALVGVTRTTGGELRFDFSALDRVLALAAKHGIDRQIDVFGLINIWVDETHGFGKAAPDAPDAVRVRCYDEASRAYTYLRTAGELGAFIRGLHDHFAALGVLDRLRVAADEPADLEQFRRSLDFVREAGPGFQYSAALNHFEFMEDAPPGVIDFIPMLPLACKDPALTARLAADLRAGGGKMHWYVCCVPPIPNTFLHSPPVEGRLIGWLTYLLRLVGFLRWAFCLWPADPWRRVSWRAPGWPAGDMYFVLPGNDGVPVETLRYEALRAAVQDYELLTQVERRLPEAEAKTVIDRAMGYILRADRIEDFAGADASQAETLYSLDPADYHAARAVLIAALSEK